MNPYKALWLEKTSYGPVLRTTHQTKQQKRTQKGVNWVSLGQDQSTEQAALGAAWQLSKAAAQSQIKGKLGIALRVGGRVGMRAVPVVGAVMLAHDLYKVGKWLYED